MKVDTPKNLDPTRRSARITLDGAPCTVIPGARQALVDRNRLLLSAEAMGVALECTELAAAYSKERIQFGRPDRHVPGGEAPLRQHVRGHRAHHQRGVGRRHGRRDRRGPALLRRRHRRHPGGAGRRPVRQPQHPGARRHRHHLGARRPPLHAPRHHAAALHRLRAGRRGPRRPQPQGRGPHQGHQAPARGRQDPRRGEGVRRLDQGPVRRGAAHQAHRDRLRDAALAQALRPRRQRHRAARDRAGVLGRGDQAAAVRHHRLEHPHDHPARQPGPDGPLGAPGAQPRGRSGASSSASPTPAPTPPA